MKLKKTQCLKKSVTSLCFSLFEAYCSQILWCLQPMRMFLLSIPIFLLREVAGLNIKGFLMQISKQFVIVKF